MFRAKREPRLSNAWFDSVKRSIADLDSAVSGVTSDSAAELVSELHTVVANAEEQIVNSERLYVSLADLGDDAESLKAPMAEMTRLEERMQSIIETGTALVDRLRPRHR